ncbi:hypothetical protein [Cesiribacter sp. SM1]|uniref:hypothetical protein n=1 Tax=Cesiribacter sp. SM1 TaxID=2861196 RepID=UPI001CD635A9|nr:hypothetical protein [Cesiribacter sp. SM1]
MANKNQVEGHPLKRPFTFGAGAIDKKENKIYIYPGTDIHQIWEGDLSKDLSKASNWRVTASLKDYQKDSSLHEYVDVILKLEKMKGNHFAFLHAEGGIGYLDKVNGQLKIFK